jgi:sugar phosphate isomerase/epimerase
VDDKKMKLACNSFIAPGDTWLEKFDNLRDIGFEGIEVRLIGDDQQQEKQISEIKTIVRHNNVKPCSLVRPTPEFLKVLTIESYEEKLIDVTKTAGFASDLGVPAIVSVGVCVVPSLPSPFLPLPMIEPSRMALLEKYLTEVGQIAKQKGAQLLIEPLNRYEGTYYHRLSEAAEILDNIDNQQLGILADVFHINIEEANTKKAVISAKKWLKHVQLGDNNRLLPGQGQFDFTNFFETLSVIDYKGYLALECIVPKGTITPLKDSFNFLKRIISEIG